jgi:hypothetical protein
MAAPVRVFHQSLAAPVGFPSPAVVWSWECRLCSGVGDSWWAWGNALEDALAHVDSQHPVEAGSDRARRRAARLLLLLVDTDREYMAQQWEQVRMEALLVGRPDPGPLSRATAWAARHA